MNGLFRYIYILAALAAVISCSNREEIEHTVDGKGRILLEYSVKGNILSKSGTPDASMESRITHLDVFFFKVTDNGGTTEKYYYTRINTCSESSGNEPLTNEKLKISTLKTEGIFKVCVLANSSKTQDELGAITSYDALEDITEGNQYVYITGADFVQAGSNTLLAPQTFLMTGDAQAPAAQPTLNTSYTSIGKCIDFSKVSNTSEDLQLDVYLVRAAAKVTINFKIKENSNVLKEFGKAEGQATGSEKYADASYYLRNLPYETTLFGESTEKRRKTNPITNAGYMECTPNQITVTAYVYSCTWGEGASESDFEHTPFLIVNLPALHYTDANKTETEYLERNYYEIPLRIKGSSASISIKRNNHYTLNATIDAPGGLTDMEPFPIESVNYEVLPWNTRTVNVGSGGGNADIQYLNLSTYHIEMRNKATDNGTIKFSSSSAVKSITLDRAYYIDKTGAEIDVTNAYSDSITASYGNAGDLNGKITIQSPVPYNNATRYMTFTISNSDSPSASTKTFTVAQYPLIYINNIMGWYSYREDVTTSNGQISHYQNKQSSGNVTKSNDGFDFRVHYDNGYFNIYVYTASGLSLVSKDGWRLQFLGGLVGGNVTMTLDNARMYNIVVSATSSEYVLGTPQLGDDGVPVNTANNAKIVSPSFMIASQLGTLNSDSEYTANSFEKAKNHCANYVETYIVDKDGDNEYDAGEEVVHLKDWRLPTAAEIGIIAKYQTTSPAMDDLLIGQYYLCITGDSNKPYVESGIADPYSGWYTRCVRDAYDANTPKQ